MNAIHPRERHRSLRCPALCVLAVSGDGCDTLRPRVGDGDGRATIHSSGTVCHIGHLYNVAVFIKSSNTIGLGSFFAGAFNRSIFCYLQNVFRFAYNSNGSATCNAYNNKLCSIIQTQHRAIGNKITSIYCFKYTVRTIFHNIFIRGSVNIDLHSTSILLIQRKNNKLFVFISGIVRYTSSI